MKKYALKIKKIIIVKLLKNGIISYKYKKTL